MTNEISLQDVANYLDNIGIQFLATIGLDGKPKVRPMQYMILDDGKLWFCTNSEKDVYKELQANPSLELCGCKLEENEIQTPWIRFSAEAVFEERQDIRGCHYRKEQYRQCPLFQDAREPHLQSFLSEEH